MATTSSLVSCQVLLFRFSFLSFLFTFWHWPICGLTAGLSRQLAPTVPHLLRYFWDNTKAFPNPIWFDLGGWFNHIYWFLCRPWKKLMGNIFFFTSLPNSPKVEFWPKLGINKIYNQKRCHIIFGLLFSAFILTVSTINSLGNMFQTPASDSVKNMVLLGRCWLTPRHY